MAYHKNYKETTSNGRGGKALTSGKYKFCFQAACVCSSSKLKDNIFNRTKIESEL